MTRQMPYEPLPASVLFGLGCVVITFHHLTVLLAMLI